ncbi:MAG: dihydrolipoamide acetyltransferase family protein [Nautiliaceae bacterium]
MEYKVTMPILSDTMDKGKIIKWYVKEGEFVKKGDKLCEVESDKATMDIESFVDGVIKKILVKEDEEVPVKSVIAIIETNTKNKVSTSSYKNEKEQKQTQKSKKESKKVDLDTLIKEVINTPKPQGTASPAAKKKAKELGIDIKELQEKGILQKPAHLKDIDNTIAKRYFTKKAIKLLKEYNLDIKEFKLNHKITSNEVLTYLKQNNIPKTTPLTPNQLAVIKNVENAIKKPTFFIFEEIEITKKENIKLTAQLIKALSLAMQKNPLTRSILKDNTLITYPTSNISVAVSREDGLFMCVIKNAEDKSLKEINEWLKEIKTKRLSIDDLSGSTFGISNLGMFGIDRFSALINDKDTGIGAFGKLSNDKIKVTFTFDHRILNGVDSAKFVNDFKEIVCMM